IASGMKNAKVLLDQIKEGKSPYHFIEIMGCPGGCINGGGQPFVKPNLKPEEGLDILDTYRQKRADILYSIDEKCAIRQSHNNPDIIKVYKDFLGEPCSELSEELLHTTYVANREKYPEIKK
ncbi:MAG: iron hydrogenase small subunit, partial [Bacilli bacterium]|nr:iron hydrogenase small subunit [Bacilli bacterium]